MSIVHDTEIDADFERYGHLGYLTRHGPDVVELRLYWQAYSCQREEAEHESNTACIFNRMRCASSEHVKVKGDVAHIVVHDTDGSVTPAYAALIKALDELNDYPVLDDDDVQSRISGMADDAIDDYIDDARTIVAGGQAAFEAHKNADLYAGNWSDYADQLPEDAAQVLAYRLAYAAIEEGW